MAKLPTSELIQAIIDAVNESGGSAGLISSTPQQPRRFSIQYASSEFELWVYIWTLTPTAVNINGQAWKYVANVRRSEDRRVVKVRGKGDLEICQVESLSQ